MSPFVERYAAVVRRHGDRTAIEGVDRRRVTHAELWHAAGALAERLRAVGVGGEDVVAIGHSRSVGWVTAVLGAWRAGAAWTAVGADLPAPRRAHMLQTARAAAWVDDEGVRRLDRLGARDGAGAGQVAGAAPGPGDVEARDPKGAPLEPPVGTGPTSPLAYVAFTSGSSGTPKGVCIEHAGLVPMLDAQIDAFALDSATRALWVLSPGFDASVSDVGTVLLAGGTLVLDAPDVLADPKRLVSTLTRRAITSIDLPPSVLARLDIDALPGALRTLVIGGEVADTASVRRAARRHRVVNVYGPTEATVCTSLEVCGTDWPGATLGQPLPHLTYREVDGELWIAGAGLARGYAADPDASADRFVWRDGRRWYRTGDRVAHRDGAWHFVGRLDRQVQLGGQRAEPGEVEAALRDLGAVAAVVPRVVDGRTRLEAYVEGVDAEGAERLRRGLTQRLPGWLVPAALTPIPRLPRTERGKVDRAALKGLAWAAAPAASVGDTPDTVDDAPAAARARRFARLFARVLGRDRVGVDDGFFDLGGDSLALISLLAYAEAEGLGITASQVHAAPTPAGLATVVGDPEHRSTEALAALVPDAPVPAAARPGGSRVVLTGATGFLGAQVRRELVARGFDVVSLVRAVDTAHARRRVGGDARVADLCNPRCGLTDADHAELVATAGLVVHLAARVSLAASYEALAPTNVDGTRHALQLAADAGAPFVHASTLSVFVASDRAPRIVREDDDATAPATLAGGYAQSKWVAEQLVRRSSVPTCIVRYGLVTPDVEVRHVPADDWMARFARDVAATGQVPGGMDALAFDATPVDHAARATVQLIERGTRGTVHVAGAVPVAAPRLVAAIRAVAGVGDRGEREPPPPARPAHTLGAARTHDGGRFDRHRALDLFAATGLRFDDRRARGYGVQAPSVSDDYLRAWMRVVLDAR